MSRRFATAVVSLAAVAAFGALAQPPAPCDNCGTVTDIRQTTEKNSWTPLGTVVPSAGPGDSIGTTGRVTSEFQIGPQGKNRGLVILGSAGGSSYARRPDSYQQPRWDVDVKMDAGGTRTLPLRYEPPFQPGDRVRVYGTQLELVQP